MAGPNIIAKLESYGTLSEAWIGDINYFTRSGAIVSEWLGINGKKLIQTVDADRPLVRQLSNGNKEIILNDTDLQLPGTPFPLITNGTIFITVKTTDANFSLLGDLTVTNRYTSIAQDGSVQSLSDIMTGVQTDYVNNILQSWSTRGDVHTAIATGEYVVVCIGQANLSNFNTLGVGRMSSSAGSAFNLVGEIESLVIYSDDLNEENRTNVYNTLIKRVQTAEPTIEYIESFTTVTPDAPFEANTGIDYDEDRDEIIMNKWGSAEGINKIIFYDRNTMSINAETPDLTGITGGSHQGLAYISHLDLYAIGKGNGLYLFQRDGTFIKSYNWPVGACNDSNLDYYNGNLYYKDTTPGFVNTYYKCIISLSEFTSIGAFNIDAYNFGGDGGFHIDAEGIWINENTITAKYTRNNVLLETIAGTNQAAAGTEGITMDNDGNVYISRDDYFHGGTPGGNRIWKYTKQ